MSPFDHRRSEPSSPPGQRRPARWLARAGLAAGLALLLAQATGVWALPDQSALRQTVPTRTPTDAPEPTEEAPTETAAPTEVPATEVPPTAAVETEVPETAVTSQPSHTPKPTATVREVRGPTRPPLVEIADGKESLLYVLLEDKETLARFVPPTPTPSPTPTPLPERLPAEVVGKIAFKSSYFGRTRHFLIDPDGSNLALLVKSWIYEAAAARERLSPDRLYYVRQAPGGNGTDLFLGSVQGGVEKQITFVGQGKAFDPAWAPDGRHIALASNQEEDDDLFVVEIWTPQDPFPKTRNLTAGDTWASDKHPSYSPDGGQIVFYSNRSGRDQLWIMGADGSNPWRLLDLDADCWDPVWLK